MKAQEIEQLIGFGFAPSDALKRSTWTKVTRVMDFLVNQGMIARCKGSIKYQKRDGSKPTQTDITCLAVVYLKSPVHQHIDELKTISQELGVPVNSGRVLKEFCTL